MTIPEWMILACSSGNNACVLMNLGKRIELRLAEMGKKRSFLFEKIPGLLSATLSLTISRDSKRCKWDVEIAEALGVRLTWLRSGRWPKLIRPESGDTEFSRQIADLILTGQAVQAVIRIVENMSEEERCELCGLMEEE